MASGLLDTEAEMGYYERAKEVFLQIGEREGFANTLLNIGTVNTEMRRFHVATSYYERALEVYKSLGYITGQEQTLQSMADNHLAEGRLDEALREIQQALQLAREHKITQDLPYIYDLLHRIYAQKGAYRKAYDYQSQFLTISDSIFNSTVVRVK